MLPHSLPLSSLPLNPTPLSLPSSLFLSDSISLSLYPSLCVTPSLSFSPFHHHSSLSLLPPSLSFIPSSLPLSLILSIYMYHSLSLSLSPPLPSLPPSLPVSQSIYLSEYLSLSTSLSQFKCCGWNNYTDWSWNLYFNCTRGNPSSERCAVPYSCCTPVPGEVGSFL